MAIFTEQHSLGPQPGCTGTGLRVSRTLFPGRQFGPAVVGSREPLGGLLRQQKSHDCFYYKKDGSTKETEKGLEGGD